MSVEPAIETPGRVEYGCFPAPPSPKPVEQSRLIPDLQDEIERLERRLIVEALRQTGGNQAKAARELGITDRIMGLRVRKYQINPKSFQAGRSPSNGSGAFPWRQA